MAPLPVGRYSGGMSLGRKIIGYAITGAFLAALLAGGWAVASAMHLRIPFWIAVAAELAFMGYAAWSNWKRNA